MPWLTTEFEIDDSDNWVMAQTFDKKGTRGVRIPLKDIRFILNLTTEEANGLLRQNSVLSREKIQYDTRTMLMHMLGREQVK